MSFHTVRFKNLKTTAIGKALCFVMFMFIVSMATADEKKPAGEGKSAPPARPPSIVVVSPIDSVIMAPKTEFVGTVYYKDISEVASEVFGKVEEVSFEEGQRVKKGRVLALLGSDLLVKTLEATIASHGQVLSDLEKARVDFKRVENLYKENSIAAQVYDEHRFRVQGLKKRSASILAEVERLRIEVDKKTIKAPFTGVVIKKHASVGEWLSPGSKVATMAMDGVVDVIVEVPEAVIRFVKPGIDVKVRVGGRETKGFVSAIIPKGDVSTRTFPVKISVKNTMSLMEGMEARALLPSAPSRRVLSINRDAVITKRGVTQLFAIIDSKAKMFPVNVIGFMGKKVGIESPGLKKGMQAVVKGNERLRDGQPVAVSKQKAPKGK